MAHWKYHISSGDAVRFAYEDEDGHHRLAWGTLRGITAPEGMDVDEPVDSYDDIDLDEWYAHIKSGQSKLKVPISDLKKRVKEEDRDTDLPLMSEDLRFSGGVDHEPAEKHYSEVLNQ